MEETLHPALYLVPVPIGHRDDITLRALNVLRQVSCIACEDTRSTGLLLSLYGINHKNLVAYHNYNEVERAAGLIDRITSGVAIALVSEAGTPCISDPGYRLVQAALERGVTVVPLPGATAFVPALIGSGFAVHEFTFLGFPPHKKGRQTFIRSLLLENRTTVIYESSHRVLKLLEELQAAGAGERPLCIARELTKKFEEFIRGTVNDCFEVLRERASQKGEFVLVLGGIGCMGKNKKGGVDT